LHVGRTHVGPNDPARFVRRIRVDADAILEIVFRRFGRHLKTRAGHIEFPTVVDAREGAVLIAGERHRGESVGAALVHETDAALAVAPSDQILAEQSHRHRRAVVLDEFLAQKRREPVATQRNAHRCSGVDGGEQLVFFS
jgi:hypothetical protein